MDVALLKIYCPELRKEGQPGFLDVPVYPKTKIISICELVLKALNCDGELSVTDVGLLLRHPNSDGCIGKWLHHDWIIEECSIDDDKIVEVRKRNVRISVRLVDNTLKKSINFDQSLPVKELLPQVCTKFGISNWEEYDLLLDQQLQHPATPTGTLQRAPDKSFLLKGQISFGKIEAYLDEKEEWKTNKLKSKLITDDDIKWLDHNLALSEQGIRSSDTLVLKRRFFYSDAVESLDIQQLNLLYSQCREEILNGAHPVNLNAAVEFAAIQCQIQYGDFKDALKMFDVSGMLPVSFVKNKKITRKDVDSYRLRIIVEWRANKGKDEKSSKQEYVRRAKALGTYGVAFFLVKEKAKLKNKMVPVLFGVAKEHVMRVDAKSKESLGRWPLQIIKRWKITDNTFTLDFGDFEPPYSMLTKEGHKIATLISGYLELIKRRLSRQSSLPDYESAVRESSAAEEFIEAPNLIDLKTEIISAKKTSPLVEGVAIPAVIRHANFGEHRAYIMTTVQTRIQRIRANLGQPISGLEWQHPAGPAGTIVTIEEEERWSLSRRDVGVHLHRLASAAGQLVRISSRTESREDLDFQHSSDSIIDELDRLAESLKRLASTKRGQQHQHELIQLAEELCNDVEKMFAALSNGEPSSPGAVLSPGRKGFLNSVCQLSETGKKLQSCAILSEREAAASSQHQLQYSVFIEQLGMATADVVRKAGLIASNSTDSTVRGNLITKAAAVGQRSLDSITLLKLARIMKLSTGSKTGDSHTENNSDVAKSLDVLKSALFELLETVMDLPDNEQNAPFEQEVSKFDQLIDRILEAFECDPTSNRPPEFDPLVKVTELLRQIDDLLVLRQSSGDCLTSSNGDLPFMERLKEMSILLTGSQTDNLEDLLDFLDRVVRLTAPGTGSSVTPVVISHVKTLLETSHHYVSYLIGRSVDGSVDHEMFPVAKAELAYLVDMLLLGESIRLEREQAFRDLMTKLNRIGQLQDPYSDISDEKIGEVWECIGELIVVLLDTIRNTNLEKLRSSGEMLRNSAQELDGQLKMLVDLWSELVESGAVAEEDFRAKFHASLTGCCDAHQVFITELTSGQLMEDDKAVARSRKVYMQQVGALQKLYKGVNCGTESCQRALSTIVEVDEDLETAITFAAASTLNGLQSPTSVTHRENQRTDVSERNRKVEELTARLTDSVQKLTTAANQRELSDFVVETLNDLNDLIDFIKKLAENERDFDKQHLNLRLLQETARSVADVIESSRSNFSKRKSILILTRADDIQSTEAAAQTCTQVLLALRDVVSLDRNQLAVTYSVWLRTAVNQLQKNKDMGADSADGAHESSVEMGFKLRHLLDIGQPLVENPTEQHMIVFINTVHDVISVLPTILSADLRETICLNVTDYLKAIELILSGRLTEQKQLDSAVDSILDLVQFLADQRPRTPLGAKPPVPLRTTSRGSTTSTTESSGDELAHAEQEIQRAAERLNAIKPRQSVYIPQDSSDQSSEYDSEDDEELESGQPLEVLGSTNVNVFDESILEACRAIMQASANLIPIAAAAQAELKASPEPSKRHFEGNWSAGFNSAAKAIASSCHKLCDAAVALMDGSGSEEKLVSAAKQVASFTAQLLVASRVKGKPTSPKIQALFRAGQTVRSCTEKLITIVKRGAQEINEEALLEEARKKTVIDNRLVGGIAQEIKATERLSLKDKELVEARKALTAARKAKYSANSSKNSGSLDDVAAQEYVLVKEREVAEARAALQAIKDLKYKTTACEEDFTGYGQGTLPRRSKPSPS